MILIPSTFFVQLGTTHLLTRHNSNISITQGLQQAFFEEANRPSFEREELPDMPEESVFEFEVPTGLEEIETSIIIPTPAETPATPLMVQPVVQPVIRAKKSKPAPKEARLTRHGVVCPSIPAGVVKKVASTFLKSNGKGQSQINKETLRSIMQTTDWFFEQVSGDLESYAAHAGRKTIDESDVTTLMKR